MENEKKVFTDDELIEEVSTEDDAPVEVIYRCKKCGQILTKDAKDCWKCSGKEIEVVVEEEFVDEIEATIDQAGSYTIQIYSGNTIMTGEFEVE